MQRLQSVLVSNKIDGSEKLMAAKIEPPGIHLVTPQTCFADLVVLGCELSAPLPDGTIFLRKSCLNLGLLWVVGCFRRLGTG